jgi:hypothetical protein
MLQTNEPFAQTHPNLQTKLPTRLSYQGTKLTRRGRDATQTAPHFELRTLTFSPAPITELRRNLWAPAYANNTGTPQNYMHKYGEFYTYVKQETMTDT